MFCFSVSEASPLPCTGAAGTQGTYHLKPPFPELAFHRTYPTFAPWTEDKWHGARSKICLAWWPPHCTRGRQSGVKKLQDRPPGGEIFNRDWKFLPLSEPNPEANPYFCGEFEKVRIEWCSAPPHRGHLDFFPPLAFLRAIGWMLYPSLLSRPLRRR